MRPLHPYVVHQGDHLAGLASRFAFEAEIDSVWQHAKNERLRKDGRVPHLLAPTDVIYLPEPERKWLPLKIGQVNTFTVPSSPLPLAVLLEHEGKALGGESCLVHLFDNGEAKSVATDAKGILRITVTSRTREVVVEVPRLAVQLHLQVGHLDPIHAGNGILQRLVNLGHWCQPRAPRRYEAMTFTRDACGEPVPLPCFDDDDDSPYPDIEAAVRAFQHAAGLAMTGILDAETIKALEQRHGV